MALYSLADVVLDSYHAGGCTTTREALEVGALVVTLPAKYLGSRWSAAYYTIMGEAWLGLGLGLGLVPTLTLALTTDPTPND